MRAEEIRAFTEQGAWVIDGDGYRYSKNSYTDWIRNKRHNLCVTQSLFVYKMTTKKQTTESKIKEIRRHTLKNYSTEEKSGL